MPLAPNVLLQANATATSKSSAANNAIKAADSGKGDGSSFSNVYAKQAKDKVADRNDTAVKPARDKSVPEKDKTDASTATAADDSTVAESGNGLPADPASASTDDKSAAEGETVAEVVTPPVTDPALDPALQLAAAQTPAALAASAAKTDSDAAKALPVLAALLTAAPVEDSFDPEADPLDGLHAVQLALENANAKAHASQQANASGRATNNADNDQSQNIANNLAALSEQLPSDESSTESSDKSFSSLISDGLKDTKSVTGDTRVDNFAERLAALSQAAQPAKTAAAPTPLINQPLAMNQSGWSEGIVDRVMYLSSQNLKSAEIKLEPAELGRLDIRVNMAPDQQTQVTFMSAHLGVREALENQMSRLRESFVQQGLGQVDVNVSDQSQQQAQQQAQEQASRAQRGGRSGGSGSGDGVDDTSVADAAAPVSQPAARVIGTSEIDFYA
ncbi:flagellar hook-length control protein FliK [Pseudomonas cichorii]|nr:flagellar hook-length control protein FliK [Pseudomonas cichorii]MBX8508311.1 flagellar hook-length control protein FliK [Pseudomonas cichorii]MBX8523350.1 flagellar hook-length control protein FliK [Pseudomonas cichorii]MBX8540636.1 flagellar hook-length control protein FliK [Pseudomonas cichorii]MBX8580359.1 flagellar hook-length control protein FliK [Pseudomonas cichorii]